MRWYFVRHGHSQWQAGLTADDDSALTSIGLSQARCLKPWLAAHFEGRPSPHVVASPLVRARQTADQMGARYEIDGRLREAEFHVASELPLPVSTMNPQCRTPPGRRYNQFRHGLSAFFHEWTEESRGERDLVFVCHGGVIKTIIRIVFDNNTIDFRINNCSITCFYWDKVRWKVEVINDTHHVPTEMIT